MAVLKYSKEKLVNLSKYLNSIIKPQSQQKLLSCEFENVHAEGGGGALVPLVWLEYRLIQSRNWKYDLHNKWCTLVDHVVFIGL